MSSLAHISNRQTALASQFDGSDALENAYRSHGALLYSVALRILNDKSEAEDCVHDALLRAWTKQSYRAERGDLRAFLVVCVRNEALTRRRAAARHLRIEQRNVPEPSVEMKLHDHVELDALGRALAALPPEQREVIDLAYFGGLSQSAIAGRIGAPLGTVKGRVSLGLRKLREALEER